MNDWNPPGAPDVSEHFNKAASQTNEQTEAERTPDIATIYEQSRLEEQRDALVLEQHHTIEGTTEHVVNEQVYDQLEERINYIRRRREAAQQKFRNNFRNSTSRR
ncbi:MAG TPA: hypothetical protein VJ784_21820 [Pyrinomonadaceae bacterium]|nr:hypothetical protein [Pyrinomonadaceae bacterium]